MQALQEVGEKIVDRGRRDGQRPDRACSAASAPTPLGCTSTSTATRRRSWASSMAEVFNTLQVYLGSLYVNDFNRFGRTWQVNVQADAHYRKQVEDLKQLKIRNARGQMVPLGTFASARGDQRPGDDLPLQHVSAAPDQRRARPRRQFRRRHTPDGGSRLGKQTKLVQAHAGTSGRNWPCCSWRPATRPCTSSCWRWCWCSSCWPPSTRAGRCRWR